MIRHLTALMLSLATAAGAATVDATIVSDGQAHRVQVRHPVEGWTWQSQVLAGTPVPHGSGSVSCADLDHDGSPEVLVTLDDQAPGGRVHVFRREPGQPAMAPVMSEVGPGLRERDFLVWDVSNGRTAPVTIAADGTISIRARHYGMLGLGDAMATYRYRMERGVIRLVETVADPVRAPAVGARR